MGGKRRNRTHWAAPILRLPEGAMGTGAVQPPLFRLIDSFFTYRAGALTPCPCIQLWGRLPLNRPPEMPVTSLALPPFIIRLWSLSTLGSSPAGLFDSPPPPPQEIPRKVSNISLLSLGPRWTSVPSQPEKCLRVGTWGSPPPLDFAPPEVSSQGSDERGSHSLTKFSL